MKIEINKLKLNSNNPRLIKDFRFKKLVNSIKEFPQMLEKRPIVVDEDYIILGGNMRYRAAKELGIKKIDVIVVKDWTEEQKKEFTIKDNVGFGDWDWDLLANDWQVEKLNSWGVNAPMFNDLEYNPNLEPQVNISEVTEKEIETKAKQLAEKMVAEYKKIDAICPNCGEEFEIKI